MRNVRCAMWAVATWLLVAGVCRAAEEAAWWDASWGYRVQVSCGAGEGDVAWVTAALNGRCEADARDLRLVDGDGKARAFVVLHHDGMNQTTLSFRADEGKATTTWLYFGNAKAEARKAEGWEPRRGVLLRTYERNNESHPTEPAAIYREIEKGKLEGAGFREGISDGYNPFGSSDRYISSYSAYLRIDKPGTYGFATVSDDGSWALVNDKPIAIWPGMHGYSGGQRGEHHGFIETGTGVLRIRYYQEEGSGDQMAYLAWQPPGTDHFVPIPKSQWLSVREAKAGGIESPDQTLIARAELKVVNSYWIYDSQDQQATLVKFTCKARDGIAGPATTGGGKIVEAKWDFGDGLTATGDNVEHVYFRLGRPVVKLTVKDDKGRTDSVTISPNLFQVDVVAAAYSYGDAKQYEKAAAAYDVTKMEREDLRLYAAFWRNLERDKPFINAAQTFVDRFGEQPSAKEQAGELAESAATAALKADVYDPAKAKKLMQWATDHEDRPAIKARRMIALAKLLAWDTGEPAEAEKLARRVKDATTKHEGKEMRLLERAATIVLGDTALLNAAYEDAAGWYQRAEEMGPDKADEPARMAKLGSAPYIVEDLLGRDEYDYAMKAIDRWEDEFPTQKLEGLTFFWRGKVLFVRKPGELALKWLVISERVNPRGLHVSEAVWLRANTLMAMGRWRDAMDQLMRIRTQFTHSEYFTKAEEKMKLCAEKMK
ncbi:MAG: PKD domain-containing protein [Phycisphaerales bacterium]